MATQNEDVFEAPAGGYRFGPIHPGRTLAAELEARGITAITLASKLRLPAERISEIVAGTRAVTAETALRLGRCFGTSAAFWMNLQAKYDLEVAERDLGERIRAEVEAA
jgi:addiction module HigA family antidote